MLIMVMQLSSQADMKEYVGTSKKPLYLFKKIRALPFVEWMKARDKGGIFYWLIFKYKLGEELIDEGASLCKILIKWY